LDVKLRVIYCDVKPLNILQIWIDHSDVDITEIIYIGNINTETLTCIYYVELIKKKSN
jgi:predicted transcriptional regulator